MREVGRVHRVDDVAELAAGVGDVVSDLGGLPFSGAVRDQYSGHWAISGELQPRCPNYPRAARTREPGPGAHTRSVPTASCGLPALRSQPERRACAPRRHAASLASTRWPPWMPARAARAHGLHAWPAQALT